MSEAEMKLNQREKECNNPMRKSTERKRRKASTSRHYDSTLTILTLFDAFLMRKQCISP